MAPALPALEIKIQFEICIFILDRKSDKQEPSRGHKFSILENVLSIRDFTSAMHLHFRSDLVGACLPQTLLYALRMFLSALLSPIKRNSSEVQRDLLPFSYLLHNFTETESEMHFIFRMRPLFVSCKFPIDFIRFCAPSCFTETLENII